MNNDETPRMEIVDGPRPVVLSAFWKAELDRIVARAGKAERRWRIATRLLPPLAIAITALVAVLLFSSCATQVLRPTERDNLAASSLAAWTFLGGRGQPPQPIIERGRPCAWGTTAAPAEVHLGYCGGPWSRTALCHEFLHVIRPHEDCQAATSEWQRAGGLHDRCLAVLREREAH